VLAVAGALFGLGVFPLLCSILAVLQGRRARREISARPELKGERMATVAIVIGVLTLIVYIALFVAIRVSGGGFGGANTFA
jgi:Domain of unknown function (DUF4190)